LILFQNRRRVINSRIFGHHSNRKALKRVVGEREAWKASEGRKADPSAALFS
jgi:hypothetical protein